MSPLLVHKEDNDLDVIGPDEQVCLALTITTSVLQYICSDVIQSWQIQVPIWILELRTVPVVTGKGKNEQRLPLAGCMPK